MGEWMEWRFLWQLLKKEDTEVSRIPAGERPETGKGMRAGSRFRWYEGMEESKKAPSSYQILPGDHFRFCTSDPGRKSDPYASLGNQDGRGASFADALLQQPSAACATGLVVQDTATYWSVSGQAVILFC